MLYLDPEPHAIPYKSSTSPYRAYELHHGLLTTTIRTHLPSLFAVSCPVSQTTNNKHSKPSPSSQCVPYLAESGFSAVSWTLCILLHCSPALSIQTADRKEESAFLWNIVSSQRRRHIPSGQANLAGSLQRLFCGQVPLSASVPGVLCCVVVVESMAIAFDAIGSFFYSA